MHPEITFFVGRRWRGRPELYALTASGVDRLGSRRRHSRARLDWYGDPLATVALSSAMLTRLAGRAPSRRLAARFAVDVLMDLPGAGFVLDAEAVRDWLVSASEPDEWLPFEPLERP